MGPRDAPYRTLAGEGHSAFSVRGSEFIGTARPVDGVGSAEEFVAAVRDANPDATHNVPCYRARDGDGVLRGYATDNGEPTGSAGKPALNILVQRDLENVAVVVTRHYGGTNLGVGGLARAYGRAVKEAIDDAGVAERRPRESFTVVVEYDDSGTVRSVLESAGVEFEADYETTVTFRVTMPREEASTLRDRLRSATNGRVSIEGVSRR